MRILAYNPGHDGAIVSLVDGRLEMSLEAEKDSNHRYSSVSSPDVFNAIGETAEIPDAVCMGGWWPRDHHEFVQGSISNAGYRGISGEGVIVGERRFLGRDVRYFSSSHERSHVLCAYGMSPLSKGLPNTWGTRTPHLPLSRRSLYATELQVRCRHGGRAT